MLRNPRKPRNGQQSPDDRFIIGTTLSPLDQAIDLADAEFEEALFKTNRERKSRTDSETNVPSGEFIRKVRGGRPQNGLLIIYPIDPDEAKVEDGVAVPVSPAYNHQQNGRQDISPGPGH